MSSPLDGLTEGQVRQTLNLGASFAVFQILADVIEKLGFDSEDAEAITWLPMGLKTHTIARIIDAAEAIREELRNVDGELLGLTAV
jgi:hypothetical protein